MTIYNDTIEIRAQRMSKAYGFTIDVSQCYIDEHGDINARLTEEQVKLLDQKDSNFWLNFDLRKVEL